MKRINLPLDMIPKDCVPMKQKDFIDNLDYRNKISTLTWFLEDLCPFWDWVVIFARLKKGGERLRWRGTSFAFLWHGW